MILGNHIKLISGQHIEVKDCNKIGNGIPYLTGPADFVSNKPLATKFTEKPKVCCEKDDILITVKGSGTGSTVLADRKYCISRQIMAIRCKEINYNFTKYLIEMNEKKYNSIAAGLIPGISRIDVLKMKIPEIPITEQKTIANILSTWDQVIEKTEKMIELKEKKFNWLVNDLVIFESKKSAWKKVKLKSIANIIKGEQLSVIDMISEGKYYVLNGGIEPSGFTDKWNTDANTISISEGGNSCGYVNFNKFKYWAGGHCYKLDIIDKKVNADFLYLYLKSCQARIMKLRVGSGLPNIQKKDIENFILLLPDKTEQFRISQALGLVRQEIDIQYKILKNYKSQKQGLMQKLLTGKWRVKV